MAKYESQTWQNPEVITWANASEAALYNQWANIYDTEDNTNDSNYFDYFFSGQDIQIRIEGLDSQADLLPIYQFGFNIQQNKQPIYGFWSYTYDYMLRGTRIVSGAFSIITKSPGYMTEMVAKAARRRSEILTSPKGGYSDSLHRIRGLDIDEKNIERFWKRNFDNSPARNRQQLFSVHPPFNFLLTYGIQETSVASLAYNTRSEYLRKMYSDSNAMMSDINERIVEVDQDRNRMRLLIENVELVSRQTEINAEGDPIIETYTFMARDLVEAPDYNPQPPAKGGPANAQ